MVGQLSTSSRGVSKDATAFPFALKTLQQSSTYAGWWYTYPSEKYESQLG
jgi:hypothetical protein